MATMIGALTALTATISTSQAQDQDQTTRPALEEVIVTGTRRSESVQDVPYNIQAVSSQTLTDIGALDQRDFGRMVPGLMMNDSGPRDGMEFVLRGLTTGVSSGTLGQTTTTYVDDTQIDLYTGLLDLKLLDVDRIEVLRGPQGTLYGGGAIGGTIRYISTKPDLVAPDARLSTGISSTAGGGTNNDVSGMLNLPLVEDKVAIRANLGYFDNDGYIDNVRLGASRINWDRTLSGRIAMLAHLVEPLKIELTHYYQQGRFGDGPSQYDMLGKERVDDFILGHLESRVGLTNLSITYDFGWSELTSSSSYARETSRDVLDGTYFIRDQVFASFMAPEDLPEMTLGSDRRRKARTFSEELRLVSKGNGRWNWLAGAYWYDRSATEKYQEFVGLPFPGQARFEDSVRCAYRLYGDCVDAPLNDNKEYFFTSDPSTINQWALFGELGLRITPQLRMSVGMRHFDYRLRETFYIIDQFFGPSSRDANGIARTTPLPEEFSFGRADDDGQIYRFNASYDVTADDLIYLTVAQGYRPGGFNLVTPNTGVPLDQRAFDPDSIVSYEVGGKLSLLDRRVYLSSAIYYIDWSDIQTGVPTDLGFTIQGNAGKASVRGFELELQSRGLLVDGLSMSVGYSYTGAKLEEPVIGLGRKGDAVPNVPKHAGSLMADYTFEPGDGWRAGVNVNTSFTDRSFTRFGPLVPEEDGSLSPDAQYLEKGAYWLTNISARLGIKSWTARLFVDNVFDDSVDLTRELHLSDSPYRGPYLSRGVNRPRTIGLELTWDLE
jgi:outer membrane receptor protein involved in Fe transport